MQFQTLFRAAVERPVRAALLGAGEFGISLIAQSRRMQGLAIEAVFDIDPARVSAVLSNMGVPHRRCSSARQARESQEQGMLALCERLDDLLALPLEIVVEATGHPEAGAAHGLAALAAGIGVAMVSKEAECVVGPILARRAAAAGLAWTLVDGDQPALLIGLVSWARTLGLPIVAAGKSSEYDYVFDPSDGCTRWLDRTVHAPDLARHWALGGDAAATVASRAGLLQALPLRTVPDSCEMTLVANATGLLPDRPDFHAPLAHTAELPELYGPRTAGGLLEQDGALDVFNCLRRPDEASFAGGVFIVVGLADLRTGELFASKGIPVSRDRHRALIYNPSHLLGVEAPISIVAAARLGHSILDEAYRPRLDLAARAARNLSAGDVLGIEGDRHAVPGLEPLLLPTVQADPASPLPYYMAVGRMLTRPVAAGATLSFGDVEVPPASVLWTLRAEQDAKFCA